jgi:Holliday junction resolvase
MNNKKIQEAKLIYDIIEKHPGLFKTKPEELINKLEQLKRGLPLENEFISLALWMGNCSLIHKFDQNQMPKWAKDHFQVVDLFAVFRHKEKLVPVLIEVKSTQEPKIKFSENYHRKIKAYARLNKLPLLVAWKVVNYGMWFLLDIERFQRKEKAYHLEFQEAVRENLLGILLDDFSIHFRPGIKFIIKFEKEKLLSQKVEKGKRVEEWHMRITEANFLNYKGQQVKIVPSLLLYMLSLAGLEEKTRSDNKYLSQIWELPKDCMIFASGMHGIAMVGIEGEYYPTKINWEEIIFNEKYKFTFDFLNKAARESMERGFVHIIGHIVPNTIPDFLRG